MKVQCINKWRILVVGSCDKFIQELSVWFKDFNINELIIAPNYHEGLLALSSEHYHICMVDLSYLETYKNGLDFARKVRLIYPSLPIIYLYDSSTELSYKNTQQLSPCSYLPKEATKLEVGYAIQLALKRSQAHPTSLYEKVPFLKIGKELKAIENVHVNYFFSEQKRVYAKIDSKKFQTPISLKQLGEWLAPHFIRIHKSYLVNLKFVESIIPENQQLLVQKDLLPIGKSYKRAFFQAIRVLR